MRRPAFGELFLRSEDQTIVDGGKRSAAPGADVPNEPLALKAQPKSGTPKPSHKEREICSLPVLGDGSILIDEPPRRFL